MSIGSIYDDILEDQECPICHYVGMEADGGFDYYCPNCGHEDSLLDEEDELEKDEEEIDKFYLR